MKAEAKHAPVPVTEMTHEELKELLDFLYDRYNREAFIAPDPISIPHRYTTPHDIEISGFFAATIAWGNRPCILRNAERLMERMENAPYDFVVNASEQELGVLADFVHRTFNGSDCMDFVLALRRFYTGEVYHNPRFAAPADPTNRESLTLGTFFEEQYASCGDLRTVLARFREAFWEAPHHARAEKHVASIERGASCKRLNMYLRWMVRHDERGVDFGLWRRIPTSALYLPLDLHTGTTARALGLLTRKYDDWRAVEEITTVLRRFNPEDPIRYDYALFGAGIQKELNYQKIF